MGYHSLLAGTHLEGLKAQDTTFHLHIWHVSCQFLDTVESAAINMTIGKKLQQVTDCRDAQFLTEHLLSVRSYTGQVLYVLLQDVGHGLGYLSKTSAIFRSNGVVILMFSRLPSTRVMSKPKASTTEASSVKLSL